MLGDLLLKIEKLHEFIDDCVSNSSLSLIDKDIILQNLRDIYLEASKIEIGDYDADFEDGFENENIILFDSKDPLKQIDHLDDSSQEVEMVQEESDLADACDDDFVECDRVDSGEDNFVQEESEVRETYMLDNEQECDDNELEQVVYISSEDNDLQMSISDYEKSIIMSELCSMDENLYNELIEKLNSFTDLDDVLIYISEEFAESQNSQSVILLADKMAERLA